MISCKLCMVFSLIFPIKNTVFGKKLQVCYLTVDYTKREHSVPLFCQLNYSYEPSSRAESESIDWMKVEECSTDQMF